MGVNAGGALFTAQAAGRQMIRFGNGGSIILVASICGSVAMEVSCCAASYPQLINPLISLISTTSHTIPPRAHSCR